MRYTGSEAYNIDLDGQGFALEQERSRPSFEVVTGGGLDARARRGVSPQFWAKVKVVVVVAAVFLVVAAARVAMSAAAVGALSNNSALRSSVTDAQNLNDDLKIERAVLSSNSRIACIATQNYGMTLSSDAVSVKVGQAAAAEQAAAEAEAQAAADEAAAAEQAAADAASAERVDAVSEGFANSAAPGYAASSNGEAAQPLVEAGALAGVA